MALGFGRRQHGPRLGLGLTDGHRHAKAWPQLCVHDPLGASQQHHVQAQAFGRLAMIALCRLQHGIHTVLRGFGVRGSVARVAKVLQGAAKAPLRTLAAL